VQAVAKLGEPSQNYLGRLVTELIREMVKRTKTQAAQRRAETGAVPLAPAAIKAQRPHHRPSKLKKSPAPLFHAATRRVRRELYDAYKFFLTAFREASERLRCGDRTARFPIGCFPPELSLRLRLIEACFHQHHLTSSLSNQPRKSWRLAKPRLWFVQRAPSDS
jgi:hypothetical protein